MTKKPTLTAIALSGGIGLKTGRYTLSEAYDLLQNAKRAEGKPGLKPLKYDAVAAKGVIAEGVSKPVDGVLPGRIVITEAGSSQLHAGICPHTGQGIRRPRHPAPSIVVVEGLVTGESRKAPESAEIN